MAAVPFHFTTTTSINPFPVKSGQTANLKGIVIVPNGQANAYKFFWFTETVANQAPVVGTTIPNLTILTLTTSTIGFSWPDGITGNGQLWMAVTGAAPDNDTTAALAGSVVTVLVE